MVSQGIDTSYNPPSGLELLNAGLTNAMLYITDPGPGNKGCTQALWDDYTRHGISIGFVWENGPDAVRKGYTQGYTDAQRAQHNLNALRGPSNQRPLYAAIDFDIQPDEYHFAAAYFTGWSKVLGRARSGAYGHFDILNYLNQQKLIQKKWQTYAWSNGKVLSQLDVLQYDNGETVGGGTVDLDRFYSSNWGQRAVLLSKPAPVVPAVKPQPDVPHLYYVVRPNDNLTSLAIKYHTTVSTLAKWNRIANVNEIQVGQKLRVR